MCLIIAVNRSRKMAVNDLAAAIDSAVWFNPDGIGLAYAKKGKAKILKKVASYDEVIDTAVDLYQFTDTPFILHLRYNTAGTNSIANAHPFRITDELVMAHNKTLEIEPALPSWSDSRTVAELLKRMCSADRLFFNSSLFYSFIEHQAQNDNRFAFLNAKDNSITIINEHLGVKHQGIWFSNLYSWDPFVLGINQFKKKNTLRATVESIAHGKDEDLSADDFAFDDDGLPLHWQFPGNACAQVD